MKNQYLHEKSVSTGKKQKKKRKTKNQKSEVRRHGDGLGEGI